MMKGVDLVKSDCEPLVRATVAVVLGFGLASCANNSQPVSEAEYSTQIVGRWQGTVGNVKETMSFDSDGTFVCQLHPTGFLANTLSQSVTGTITGTWKIAGAIIILKITGEKNENSVNRIASSTIVAFKGDELVLKSDRGETAPFQRVRALSPKVYRKAEAEAQVGARESSPQQPGIPSEPQLEERL